MAIFKKLDVEISSKSIPMLVHKMPPSLLTNWFFLGRSIIRYAL